uniref:Vacuolar fusion protein MON1 homolog n=1 Tax=Sphenodon punctatus TaxID=8508 RepID=A0A8D0GYV3_SPHPU
MEAADPDVPPAKGEGLEIPGEQTGPCPTETDGDEPDSVPEELCAIPAEPDSVVEEAGAEPDSVPEDLGTIPAEPPAPQSNGPLSTADGKVDAREELSDKELSDSASTDNVLEDSSEFGPPAVAVGGSGGPAGEEVVVPAVTTHRDEDVTAESWRKRRKHVFVLSEAGKPIYSRYGNEEALSSTMGVMMALVSFIQSGDNAIRSICSDDRKLVFVQQGPLVLVSVSRTLQSEQQLRQELLYVYYQIISMLTQVSITRIFERKKNYDLRRLLAGSEKILDRLLNLVESDPSFLLNAVRCLPLPASLRDSLGALLQKAITSNLVFSILVARSQLVTTVQEKTVIEDCRLEPTDLHLLLNLISATSAFQAGEIWTPICLPRFNPDGYFYAYISYLDAECTVCLILLSTDKESFYSVSDCKKRIEEGMRTQGYLQALSAGGSSQSPSYSVGLVGVPDLRHFMYKPLDIPENYRQLPQFTSPELESPYHSERERHRLFDLYHYLHSRIHSGCRPLRLIYHVAAKETLLAWVTSKFELYTCFSPLVTKAGAINVLTKLLRWIKKEEDRLFIRYPPRYSPTPNPGKSVKGGRSDGAENGFFAGL